MSEQESTSMNVVSPGFYRGLVLKHLRNGMCKIWIPGVYPAELSSYEEADKLPSAEQASPIAFGANDGNGVFSYPNIGSVVWCFFQNNDQNYPVYFASALGGSKTYDDGKGSEDEDTKDNRWKTVFNMPGQHPEDAFMHRITAGDSDIRIWETGKVKVETADRNGYLKSTVDIDENGNVVIDSSMKIALHSSEILLSGDTQIDLHAPDIKVNGSIQTLIQSNAINLDAAKGHVVMQSRTGSKTI